jgi:predicted regulator of Ras-like GTPase activity (Roadblock/LC7/MglB family)
MNVFQDSLRRIAERVEGTRAVSLVGVDGIPIDTYGPGEGVSVESVAAELGSFVKSSRPAEPGGGGAVEQLCLVTDEGKAIFSRVTEEYYLLLLLSREGNFGRGRFELRKAALALEKELL